MSLQLIANELRGARQDLSGCLSHYSANDDGATAFLVTFTVKGESHRRHCIAHNVGEACRIALAGQTDIPVRMKVSKA